MCKKNLPKIDLITINYNGLFFLEEFFQSLNKLNYPKDRLEVFFVDNNSKDDSIDFVRSVKVDFGLKIIRNCRNYGFAKANNLIFPKCKAEYIALLNNDTRVDRNWLIRLVEKIEPDSGIGIACSKRIPIEAPRYIDLTTLETSWCSGGSCLIRKKALDDVGYFDEKFFMYGEDNDLSWRMWISGWRCIYVPESLCEHHFGKEEKYHFRRNYFHVRNSILLRYIYGSFCDIWMVYIRWLRDGLSLGLKKYRFEEATAIFGAIIGHIPYIFHFIQRRHNLKNRRNKWISL